MTGTITYEIPECSVPEVDIVGIPTTVCSGSDMELTPSINDAANYQYQWTVSGTGWSIQAGSALRQSTIHIGSSEGTITLKVSDKNNSTTCFKEKTIRVTPERTVTIAKPIIEASNSGVICGDAAVNVTVTNTQENATYTLLYGDTPQGDPKAGNAGSVTFTGITTTGSYKVSAEATATDVCSTTEMSDPVAISSIGFTQQEYITTPWVPVSVVVDVPENTIYTYDDSAIENTSITFDSGYSPIINTNGNTYTYKIPRPTAWGTGNNDTSIDNVEFVVKANIATCEATAKVILQDEGNDNCTTTNP
jgi:hypothetical protein